MESWMISLGIAIIAVIGSAYVTRYMVAELMKTSDVHSERLEKHGDNLVELNTKSELSMTAKDVDEKYVSKELFRQFEKHMDKRFDSVEDGMGKILSYVEGRSK